MSKFISVLLVLLNGVLTWLINQIPTKEYLLSIPLSYILGMTGGCLLLVIILTLLGDDSPKQTGISNSGWLSSLFPLLGGGIIYVLFATNSLPEAFKPSLFYTSLFLFSLGMLWPVLLALFKVRKTLRKEVNLLYLLLIGMGLFLTIHFYWHNQWIIGTITLILTVIIFLSPLLVKFVKKLEQEFEARIKQLINNLQNFWAETILSKWIFFLTSPEQRKYYQSLIYSCQDYQTQELKSKGLFSLDLEKVFVPLKITPESAAKISSQIIQPADESKGLNIWDFLAVSLTQPQFRTLKVIGAPGSGKTTLLKHLTLIYAKNSQRKQHQKAPKLIPVLISLRKEDVQKAIASQNLSLGELIKQQPSIRKLNLPPRWFEQKLRSQNFLVMLDGLDEVTDENQRQRVSDWLNQQMQDYSKAIFLVTSRPFAFKSAPIEGVIELEIKPFNLTQMEQFIHNWYLQGQAMSVMNILENEDEEVKEVAQKQANDLIERTKNSPSLASMALNPLLATMIATVHYCGETLPEERVELYGKIFDLLLERSQQANDIQQSLTLSQKKLLLQVLALGLMEKNTYQFTLALAEELIPEELAKVTNLLLQKFLEDLENDSGLLVEREKGVYEFAHKSFQEYLAAVQIQESNQESLLIDNISNGWWEETIRFYFVQRDATNLVRAALKNPTVISLKLAYNCLEENSRVEPEVREQLKDILEAELDSPEPEIVSLAAKVKLARRLSHFLRIDEKTTIDQYYITCAEYQLFVDEYFNSGERFPQGNASKPITKISWNDAVSFCAWMSSKTQFNGEEKEQNQVYYYRLPTAIEVQNYPVREYPQLGSWNMGGSNKTEKGIQLVKTKIPSLFEFEVITVNAQGQEIQRQRRYNQYLTEYLANDVNLDMVAIPGGTFLMGTEDEEIEKLTQKFGDYFQDEKPQHQVTVPSFYMSKYPITQRQWKAIALRTDLKVEIDLEPEPAYFKDNPESFSFPSTRGKLDLPYYGENPSYLDRPVEQVNWYQAKEFCDRLSQLTGKEYRLPTEAEWEYACRADLAKFPFKRATSSPPFHFGETITLDLANYRGNYSNYPDEQKGVNRGETTPVGMFPPNAFGLSDMHGNVWEWCEDNKHDNYNNAPTDGSAWLQPKNNTKILRGGSWFSDSHNCRSASRSEGFTRGDNGNIGFRVVSVLLRTVDS